MDELLDAFSDSSDSALGPGDIHYQVLKHLLSEAFCARLNTLNDIWITGNFTSTWWSSYVVPKSFSRSIQLPSHCSYKLCLWSAWSVRRLVPWEKEAYRSHAEWFPQRPKYNRMFRIFHKRGLHLEATCYCYFLLPGKGIWYYRAVCHVERLKWCWFVRATSSHHIWLFLR